MKLYKRTVMGIDASGDSQILKTDTNGKLLITEDNSTDVLTALEAIQAALEESGASKEVLDSIQTAVEAVQAALEEGGASKEILDNIEAGIDEIKVILGEVQESPTSNTNLDRLKALKTSIDSLITIMGEVQASPTENTLLERVKVLEDALNNISGTHDSAAPSKIIILGGKAETTLPTAVADGDAVNMLMDEYGRPWILGYNSSQGSLDVNLINYPMAPIENTWTTLTAAGSSSFIDVSYYKNIVLKVVVASVNTTVDFTLEGSMDGTNVFDMEDQDGNGTIQKGANGTYHFFYSLSNDNTYGKSAKYVRFTFDTEAGGTDVTLAPTIYAFR